ncbi:MAG: transcription-repair coupling factor [Arenicellaceae bacterium]|nr:transcription-repair coupling factor [Arenicellaceae bacterium]
MTSLSLKGHSPFQPVLPETPGSRVFWRHLHGSAQDIAIVEAAQHNSSNGAATLLVCPDATSIYHRAQSTRFYAVDSFEPKICLFPDTECLPYDRFSPHQDITSTRLLTLLELTQGFNGLLIAPASALLRRLPPQNHVKGSAFHLTIGQQLEITAFTNTLVDTGYYSVNQVMSPGEFAVRGGLVDVYPMGTETPFRIDLFDTEIENIRLFDTSTQRSGETISTIRLLPAREFPTHEQAISDFRQRFRARFEGDPQKSRAYRDLSNGIIPAGSECYLPLFFEHTVSLLDYLSDDTLIILDDGASEATEGTVNEIKERYDYALLDTEWPALKPEEIALTQQDWLDKLKPKKRVQLLTLNLDDQKKHVYEYLTNKPTEFNINVRSESPYGPLTKYLQTNAARVLLVAESIGRRETLNGLLQDHQLDASTVESWHDFLKGDARLNITSAPLEYGFRIEHTETSTAIDNDLGNHLEVITESQIYGERVLQKRRRSDRNKNPDVIIRSLAELKLGDPVVHDNHGVGRYRGLTTLTIDGLDNEYLTLEYANQDKLYIPVLSLEAVSRYVAGNPDTAPIHKLGSEAWLKAKKRAQEKAYDVAAELLEVQALRSSRQGHCFPNVDANYDTFAAGFSFEETPDQLQVIDDVISDMTQAKPMDRLVCGDVGFGKTEIAMRATYIAIAGQKQVVVVVPTTLLAQQHYDNFCDRFADWPVKVDLLSRFRIKSETLTALEGIATGTVDIAIGTHRLLQKDIRFKRLGLVIIDEEHRFGVRQKERLKQLRSEVDILTLTATPIPRTLNFALSGLRDISIIATPPRARLAVKTFVREWNEGMIKEACVREIRRGGQVYFLHNEVQTIEKIEAELNLLMPDVSIRHAHGQMRERELEGIMRDFYHQRFNILLCTTIIESGIDVPTANTIIINRADKFGLAQLHQLRGRVGRSHHQAFAYLLTPPLKQLTADAKKRLTAIEALDELGAGFALASQDLEIRGAGELLGESQSGMIDEVGFSLYSEFLDQAINSLKKYKDRHYQLADKESLEVNLQIAARFPDEYISDVHIRLTMYKQISSAMDHEQLQNIAAETVDRFGLMPDATKSLFTISELKLQARKLDLKKIETGSKGATFEFLENPKINLDRLIQLIAEDPKQYGMKNSSTFQVRRDLEDAESKFDLLKEIFVTLSD